MSSFKSRVEPAQAPAPDPTKHVNYVQGMVLGVDDFTQEFAYLSGRDQWLARDLVGYGTVWGLRVHTGTGDRGPEVIVDPGVAVSPRGQFIRVTPAQCAKLNDWLAIDKNKQELIRRLGSGRSVDLYAVLCYRDCPTDNVPIPGEPCRSEEDSMASSRLADDFLLELRFSPPNQVEEDAIRDFVLWLRQIEITAEPGSFTSLEGFLKAIRSAAATIASPPSTDFMLGSPPVSIRIHPDDVCEYLRAAFRLWVTELRPRWRPAGLGMGRSYTGSMPGEEQPQEEECLLLARVSVPIVRELTGQLKVDSAREITVDEERRPFLIHLRMLQEWLLCGGREQLLASPPSGGGGVTNLAGDATGPVGATRVERIRGVAVDPTAPAQDQVLTFRAGQWRPAALPPAAAAINPSNTVTAEQSFGQASNAGALATYSRADHTHGTPPLPPIPAPADTVIAETSFGRAASAGTATGYSRADHTHGTPVAPTVAGNFIEHPAGQPRYAIVAAGIVRGNGNSRQPIYNGLRARVLGAGQMLLRFGGYRVPDTFQYIIKVLSVADAELGIIPIVLFDQFSPEGVALRVIANNQLVDPERLQRLELMVEISQYPFAE